MPASLSPSQVAQYQRDGFLYPVDCLTQAEVRYFRGRMEEFERQQGVGSPGTELEFAL